MKKIIIGALALLTIGIVGVAISNKVVGATDQGKPVITIDPIDKKTDNPTTEETDKKVYNYNIYKGSKFILEYDIKPEKIEDYIKDNGGKTEATIKHYLEIKSDEEFEVLSVEANGKNTTKDGIKFILPEIQYMYDHTNGKKNLIANNMNVKITFRVKNTINKTYENFNDRILYKYKNLEEKEVFKKISKQQTINIIELIYKGGKIEGVGEPSKNIDLGREFLIKHSITPGNVEPKGNEGGIPTTFTDQTKRNLIYVIDKAAIDLEGGNDEFARDSIIKGLELIKDSGVTTSLIVYGEKAEIIKSDDKDSFSIDEIIGLIEKIESNDKSGNLGDALRKAEILSSKTEGEDSVIVVSAGDPNYYTQVSEGNSAMLYTMADKDGFSMDDRDLSEEYTNKVINEIVMNSEENTRWYGINYGLEKEEVLLNNAIRKLDGSTLEVKKPYYDDFVSINRKAISAITLRGKFIVNSKNESIKIHEDDKSRDLELEYNEKLEPISQNIDTRIRIVDLRDMDDEEKGFDVASPKNIEVKLIVEFNGEKKEIEFNTPNENGESVIKWWIKPNVPYVVRTGLYNGRKKLVGKTRDVQEAIDDVKWASSQLLDELSDVELATENYFSVGMLIKSQTEISLEPIEPVKRNMNNNKFSNSTEIKNYTWNEDNGFNNTTMIEYYILDENNEFIPYTGNNFEPSNIYLIIIEHYIKEEPGEKFDIGFEVGEEKDFWGVKVNVVDKPEHF